MKVRVPSSPIMTSVFNCQRRGSVPVRMRPTFSMQTECDKEELVSALTYFPLSVSLRPPMAF